MNETRDALGRLSYISFLNAAIVPGGSSTHDLEPSNLCSLTRYVPHSSVQLGARLMYLFFCLTNWTAECEIFSADCTRQAFIQHMNVDSVDGPVKVRNVNDKVVCHCYY